MKMYGPSFDKSGKLVERDVPEVDIQAFERAGYIIGELTEEVKAKAKAEADAEAAKAKESAPKKKGK